MPLVRAVYIIKSCFFQIKILKMRKFHRLTFGFLRDVQMFGYSDIPIIWYSDVHLSHSFLRSHMMTV